MRKIFSKALCLMLIIMMVSTMLVQASTDVIMETVHEETNIVANTGYFQVDGAWANSPVSFANGKWTMSCATVGGNHGINFHMLKDSALKSQIKDLNKVVYTVSFDLHKADMVGDFTVYSLGYGTDSIPVEISNITITDSSDSNTLCIYGPAGNDMIYAPWTADGTVKCTISYNSETRVMSVKAEGHNAVIKSTLNNNAVGSSITGYGIRLKGTGNAVISVSDVTMKIEQPSDKVVENVSDKFMGKLAENKNITAAQSGDMQIIHWNPSNSTSNTMTCENGKFTSNAISGNRGIILGLPKNSSLKESVDMTNVVYTASFKLHRGARGGNFTIDVLGYDSDSVESTTIVLLNEETTDGDFRFNSTDVTTPKTVAWNQDSTVDCTLTYDAKAQVATVKVGEEEITKTFKEKNYNSSNEAAAYGFRLKGPSSGTTTISISSVSLKVEQPIELTVKGQTISMPLYKPAGSSDKLIIACYDNSGDFISAEIKDVGEWTADNIANKQYEFTTSLTGNVRIFLWEDFSSLTPLIDSLDHNI